MRKTVDNQPVVEYRLRPAVGLRILGFGCIALVVPVLIELARRTVDALDVTAIAILAWLSLAVAAAILLVGGWLLVDRRPRLRLDATACTVRSAYGLRATTVPWKDIRDVRLVPAPGGAVLLLERGDGRAATVQPRYLDGARAVIEEQLRSRLDSAYGYRPVRPEDFAPEPGSPAGE